MCCISISIFTLTSRRLWYPWPQQIFWVNAALCERLRGFDQRVSRCGGSEGEEIVSQCAERVRCSYRKQTVELALCASAISRPESLLPPSPLPLFPLVRFLAVVHLLLGQMRVVLCLAPTTGCFHSLRNFASAVFGVEHKHTERATL